MPARQNCWFHFGALDKVILCKWHMLSDVLLVHRSTVYLLLLH